MFILKTKCVVCTICDNERSLVPCYHNNEHGCSYVYYHGPYIMKLVLWYYGVLSTPVVSLYCCVLMRNFQNA